MADALASLLMKGTCHSKMITTRIGRRWKRCMGADWILTVRKHIVKVRLYGVLELLIVTQFRVNRVLQMEGSACSSRDLQVRLVH